jgi:hypothetical protein
VVSITSSREFLIDQPWPPISCYDNLGTTYLTANPMFHVQTKHIQVHFHFIGKKVAQGALNVKFVCSKDQVADAFSKHATKLVLERLKASINLVSLHKD